MSERKDEQWLDRELRRAVEGTTPVFDAQAWRQKHRAEYEALLSRRDPTNKARQGMPHPMVLGRWFGALAVAAAVMVVAGVLLLSRPEPDAHPPTPGPAASVSSPAQMMTMMSLQAAYQQGGTEALERQFDKALKMLGPRTTSMSSQELFES
jgi:hypothetical protein